MGTLIVRVLEEVAMAAMASYDGTLTVMFLKGIDEPKPRMSSRT